MSEQNKESTRTCFVITPLGDSQRHPDVSFSGHIYSEIIKPIINNFNGLYKYNCDLASSPQSGSILDYILKKVIESDLVIADLTDLNPNVFWELGIRHAFKPSGTILICMKFDKDKSVKLPFDIADLKTFIYSPYNFKDFVKDFRNKLLDCLKHIETQPEYFDSPIYARDIGDIKTDKKKLKALEEQVQNLNTQAQKTEIPPDYQSIKNWALTLEKSLQDNKIDLPYGRPMEIDE